MIYKSFATHIEQKNIRFMDSKLKIKDSQLYGYEAQNQRLR